MLLEVPNFANSVQSLLSILASALLMMLQRLEMIYLMMYVQPLLSTHSERSSKPTSLPRHIHPNFCFFWSLSVAMTPAMSQVNDYSCLLYLYGLPRACLWMEIKHYKNTVRICFSERTPWYFLVTSHLHHTAVSICI